MFTKDLLMGLGSLLFPLGLLSPWYLAPNCALRHDGTGSKQSGRLGDRPPLNKVDASLAKKVEDLIEKLSSDDFQTREDAFETLVKMKEALPFLETLRQHPDSELRRRAEAIIVQQVEQQQLRRLRTLLHGKDQVPVDLLVEAFVRNQAAIDDAAWRSALALAEAVGRKVEKGTGIRVALSLTRKEDGDFELPDSYMDYAVAKMARLIRQRGIGHFRILATEVETKFDIGPCLIVCTGNVHLETSLGASVVLTTGDVSTVEKSQIGGSIDNSLVICDGNVRSHSIRHSIVIATGEIICKSPPEASIILAGTKVSGVVKHFRLVDYGLELFESDRGPVVSTVAKNSLFWSAGLRVGDVLLASDGSRPSVRDMTKSVRRAMASGSAIGIGILRSGETSRSVVDFDRLVSDPK